AEWLRRWTANPLGFPRVSSNLILIATRVFVIVIYGFAINYLSLLKPYHTTVPADPSLRRLDKIGSTDR
ncbi:unnamed protein product, partial [Onchocerca flexuosa]|uniref:Variant Ionotropic Glutamate Receptor n=1 Tax=Onchocerca flexuosa TaxID=387005 RepID=A0A183HAE8_9BILA